jgi:predicted nucleic acid-binding protein
MRFPDAADPSRVVDASAAARWLIEGHREVGELLRGGGNAAPSFMALEVAQAFVRQVRTARVDLADAIDAMHDLLSAGVEFVPAEALATSALAVGLELGLSAYDASYVALARTYDVGLVTADRRLAAAYDRAELLT